ncbi:replication-relaxation family protein [Priestia megaterium]|uniref:replication-relaxation family protein n=1 Tax=Priestia megaterium TaxID=1404 RepID=UPI0037CC8717
MRKFLALSEEDQSLLLHLHQHIYLSRDFIDSYIYNSAEKTKSAHEKSVYRRLKQLTDAGYITSFAVPITAGSGRPSNIYTLNDFGVDTVEQLTGIKHWNYKWSKEPQIWYMHTLALAEIVKSFETYDPSRYVVKQFISEAKAHFKYYERNDISKKSEPKVIRPDGILIIGSPNSDENLGIMVEMEKSYADKSGTIRKLKQYNHFFGRVIEENDQDLIKQFDEKVGFEHSIIEWRILFVGDNGSMGKRILRQLQGQESIVELVATSKEEILKDPYGDIYLHLGEPNTLSRM